MRVSGIGGARWPGDGTGGVVIPTGAGAIAIVRADTSLIDPGFLAWYLAREATASALDREAAATNIRFVAIRNLRKLLVQLPPLSVQRRVRELLEAQRRIELLQDQHREITRRYLDAVAENLVNSKNAHSTSHT